MTSKPVSMTKPSTPAPKPLHPSFTKSLGTLALEAHARGEHTKRSSLVCAACREDALPPRVAPTHEG